MSFDRAPERRTVAGTEESLTAQQRRNLSRSAATVAARTRDYLPGEYAVGSELAAERGEVRAYVAVRPPAGQPVSAGFEPDFDEDPLLDDEERDEVARGLAASAALQVNEALADHDGDAVAR
jgi:hypothetical protein